MENSTQFENDQTVVLDKIHVALSELNKTVKNQTMIIEKNDHVDLIKEQNSVMKEIRDNLDVLIQQNAETVTPDDKIEIFKIGDYLWIVLLIFVATRVTLYLKNRNVWFNSAQTEIEREISKSERANNLTMAGFSLAAITLFITMGTTLFEKPINQIQDTIFFLSISLVSFMMAAYFYNFATTRLNSYISASLEWLGMLSVAISLLIFFTTNFMDDLKFQILYFVFFASLIAISTQEIALFTRYFNNLKPNEKKDQI